MTDEAPSTLRLILRELPQRKVALVSLALALVCGAIVHHRGWQLGEAHRPRPRLAEVLEKDPNGPGCFVRLTNVQDPARFFWPWEWTSDEWRETFLWK